MSTTQTTRPECCTDTMLEYLDGLRASGVTNMFGAAPYLERAFPRKLDAAGARKVLVYWMQSFSQRHPK